MVKVLTFPTLSPCQVDDFKPGAKRSVKGALHLKPSTVMMLTGDEWNHIQKHYKHLASKMKVVSETSQPAPATKKAAAPTTEEKPAVDEAKEDVEDKKPSGGGGGFKRKKVKPGSK